MVIYIYGSEDFKKDIHSLLEHSNIKLRLDENGQIIDLKNVDELKHAIKDNPNNIYLIDDSKIIKKNSLNQKLKFLQPKDGIEQEYLLDNGIGDLSVDSIDELAKYIKDRLDSIIDKNESENIQDSIVEIVENAYENDSEESSDYIQLDDELSKLLSHKDDEKIEESSGVEQIDDISDLLNEEENEEKNPIEEEEDELLKEYIFNNNIDSTEDPLKDIMDFENSLEDIIDEDPLKDIVSEDENTQELDVQDPLESLSFEEDFGNIEQSDETKEETKKELNNQGDFMADEFSEFDTLNEADLLAALDGMDTNIQTVKPIPSTKNEAVASNESTSNNINLGSSSSDDLAKLISQLLNNKTLEITIKVKD